MSCTAAEEAAQALAFARRHGLEVAVRGGGHCFAGFSSTRGLVLDVAPLCSVAAAGGVVRSLTFRPRPAPRSLANFHLAWPHGQAAAVIAAWQRWAPCGPSELAADLELAAAGDLASAPTVEVYGAVLGTRATQTGCLTS